MLPFTDLHQAPAKYPNPWGRGMHHTEMMKRLKLLNANINAPLPEHYPGWFPGKEHGITCLWIGEPSLPTSRKICAFTLGAIPEFTIKDENGNLQQKGWRAIFAKLIRARAVKKRDLERVFSVTLDRNMKQSDGTCWHCARAGKSVRSDGGKDGLCKLHDRIMKICARAKEHKKERIWKRSLSPGTLEKLSRPRTMLDLASGAPETAKRSAKAK